LCGQMAK